MLYKLEDKYIEEDKRSIKLHDYDEVFILRYANFKSYVEAFIGRGEYKEQDCLNGAVLNEATYDLLIPCRVVEFRHHYLIEVKGHKYVWHRCFRAKDGNFISVGKSGNLFNDNDSDLE